MNKQELPPYRHTAERLQELEAKVVELQEANEAQKRVNRSYMERIFTLEGQNQKLQDEQRQQLDRIAELERWKKVHDEWHNDSLEPLLDERIKQLASDRDEIFAALERARIPRHF